MPSYLKIPMHKQEHIKDNKSHIQRSIAYSTQDQHHQVKSSQHVYRILEFVAKETLTSCYNNKAYSRDHIIIIEVRPLLRTPYQAY